MTAPRTLVTLIFLLQLVVCFAQPADRSFEFAFGSDVFDGDRKIKIFVPERYNQDTMETFIVTYVLDAQSDAFWQMATGTIGYLVEQQAILPTIVVGVVSENRGTEFSPKSRQLAEHLCKEIFPLIEQEYRINDFRILVGHSWGGAFVGNTLFSEDADLFAAYLGISPSLGAINGRILTHADSILQSGKKLPKFFYCSSGDLGITEYESREDIQAMEEIVQRYPTSGLVWQNQVFPNTDHWSCVIPSLTNGLLAITRNYYPDAKVIHDFLANQQVSLKAQITDFYTRQQAAFGYTYHPQAFRWELMGDDLLELSAYEGAKDLYLLAIEEGHTHDVVLYFKLTQAYDALEDVPNTRTYLAKTSALLETLKGEITPGLYNSLRKAVDKLGSKYE